MDAVADRLFAALRDSGMREVPERFSVALAHQEISRAILAEIDDFIRTFDRVTTRPAWQEMVTAFAPEIARRRRSEVCFFSAWDVHLPSERPADWQLIECNDNGSGFLFAALINRLFYEVSGLCDDPAVEAPPQFATVVAHVVRMVEREAREFFGEFPRHLFLVLDDLESLERGKFRHELVLLCELLRQQGWPAQLGTPAATRWNGRQLFWHGQEVSFIVNRSTDFFWQDDVCAALRAAYQAGRIYVAPNPFTYATRSDKRLLEFLSRSDWDGELGIQAEERALLGRHVPVTYLLRDDNVDDLVRRKEEFVFKPVHGFASRGLLTSAQVGRTRLRRLLKKGEGYVAQQRVAKSRVRAPGAAEISLWADLRVWAYRGERFLLSGRASRAPDVLDLGSPGGWLPTYARTS